MTLEGPQPAASWVIYGTPAAAEDVISYFEDELSARGWQEAPGIPSTSEVDALQWRRGDVALRLGIKDVDEWYERIEGSDAYATMYEIRLSERRGVSE